jgi:5-hydroxyisourate hydrolase
MIMAGRLTTHVLDTMHGCPAAGMRIELWSLVDGGRKLLKTLETGADGRSQQPLLQGDEMRTGTFELVFFVGNYFATKAASLPQPRFLDAVPVRFGIADASANYHIPLLCSPWAYSTYRGS